MRHALTLCMSIYLAASDDKWKTFRSLTGFSVSESLSEEDKKKKIEKTEFENRFDAVTRLRQISLRLH